MLNHCDTILIKYAQIFLTILDSHASHAQFFTTSLIHQLLQPNLLCSSRSTCPYASLQQGLFYQPYSHSGKEIQKMVHRGISGPIGNCEQSSIGTIIWGQISPHIINLQFFLGTLLLLFLKMRFTRLRAPRSEPLLQWDHCSNN